MVKKLVIASISLLLLLTFILTGCIEINSPPAQSSPSSVPSPEPEQEYRTLTFDLDEDNPEYTFPIYLRNDETLHLYWWVESKGNRAWFHIFTPSGKVLGFYDDEGAFANNTLAEGFTREMTEGVTQFSPSDYDWGEGYYTMHVIGSGQEPVMVRVEWWIEE